MRFSKNRNEIKKIICASMIFVLIAASIPSWKTVGNVHADELSEAEEKKAEATEKKKEAQMKLTSLKNEKDDVLNLIEKLDTEIADYEDKIRTLDNKGHELRAEAAVIENALDAAYVLENRQYEEMKDRIQFAYENGDADYIQALLSIKEYSSVINQSEYVDKVSLYDQKQLKELLKIEQNISEYKHSVSLNLAEVQELKNEAQGEQEALSVRKESNYKGI